MEPRPFVRRYGAGVHIGNWVEEDKLNEDVAEGRALGTIKPDSVKTRSSPFVVKQDLTLTDMQSTTKSTYQGVQIPTDSRGKRGDVIEDAFVATARSMLKQPEPEKVEMKATSREYGGWSPVQPTAPPVTSTTLMKKERSYRTEQGPPTEEELAELREKIAHPPPLSEPISIYCKEDGTQTRSLAGTFSSAVGGKTTFRKQSDFTMPIDQYTKSKWKDI
ncbi:uncharacterized protein MONOS_163 [Monocercomonoides exilis]|uniref:uncharacterized protein n=1 Tax=Monocercomonoides exilis TaxID=2049356 RepID=UPI00355AA643|nr:hypothetical protein MONOS_163 [Monocercomonoides exilis]|eukprot:MONOS_163.1-p1 / transcript=MONOS_163.1 / gene=MONOS_163 / organism=Monocercomonoides_exilis_PA203 / gene_product=unspecified product / transcript_product=unspecified product / location=Mono_scaffold00003:65220-66059(+) / protein_length=219 / sequence_SO=supercontig / SO=protein_coding / is_pseudo=false